MILLYYCIVILSYCYIVILLYCNCNVVILYHIVILSFYHIVILLYYYIVILLCCYTVMLSYCYVVILLLLYFNVILLFMVIAVYCYIIILFAIMYRFDHRDNVTEETLSQIRDKIDHEQGRQRRLLNRNVSNESSSELSYSNSHAGLSQNNTASSLTLAQTVAMDTVSNDNQAHSFGTFSDVRSTVPVDDAVVCMSDSWGHFRMQVAPLSSGNDVVMRDELRVTEADVGNAKVVIRKEKEETIETVNQLQKV